MTSNISTYYFSGKIFPKNRNPEELRITDIGVYSITKKNEAFFITNLITKFFANDKITVTDSTACIGGNSISFISNEQVKHVNCVELNKLHSKIIIIDDDEILVTSANLTIVAMESNIETGIWTKDKKIVNACKEIFEDFEHRKIFVPLEEKKY